MGNWIFVIFLFLWIGQKLSMFMLYIHDRYGQCLFIRWPDTSSLQQALTGTNVLSTNWPKWFWSFWSTNLYNVFNSFVLYFSTAKIWDIRNLKSGGKSNKWLDQIGHSKNVYSAYFSPLSGKYILTTSLDATLK